MGCNTLAQTVLLLVTVGSVLTLDAHSGTGSIVARDTDKVSALRNKLAKLSNLLALLEDGDENDLQKVAEQKKTHLPPKVPLVSEDMGVEEHIQGTPASPSPPKPQQKPVASQPSTKPLVSQDSSIRILAKALAKLKEPNFNNGDSTGDVPVHHTERPTPGDTECHHADDDHPWRDHLGTESNEAGSSDQRSLEMEHVIEEALKRLDQDKRDNTVNKKPPSAVSSGLSRNPDGQGSRMKDQGLRVIESRLMHDILLANDMGISVDDIIQDLDNRATKESKLAKTEDEFNDLSLRK